MKKIKDEPDGKIMMNSYYGRPVQCNYKLGMVYEPNDNSYCINVETGETALLVQQDIDFPDHDYVGPDTAEGGAFFVIVKEPHHELIFAPADYEVFVHVKSSNTGNVYRTLYKQS